MKHPALLMGLVTGAVILTATKNNDAQDVTAYHDIIRKSDICIPWRWAGSEDVKAYHADVLGWGPNPESCARIVPNFKRNGVRHVGCSMNLIIMGHRDSPEMQPYLNDPERRKTLAQDYRGEPMIVSWWGDALWRCPLNERSKQDLFGFMEAAVGSDVDSLHLDGALCTLCAIWNAQTGLGCFCDDVVEAFNGYLSRTYSVAQLSDMGVKDIRTFHYRRYLQQLYPNYDDYERAFKAKTIPLMEAYRSHQFCMISDLYRELIARFRLLTGKHMALGANLNSLRFNMLPPVDAVDYLYCEMKYTETGDYEVMAFKLAEALNKPFCAFAEGRSISVIREQRIPNIFKRWIGLTYAMGANFGIPSLRALRFEEEELEALRFDRDAYVAYFDMIHAHPDLFNGYEPVGQVAVLFSNKQQWHQPMLGFNEFCRTMLDTNIQFDFVVAGDDRLAYTLKPEDLAGYEAIIVAGNPRLDPAQQQVARAAGDRVRQVSLDASTSVIRATLGDIHPVVAIAGHVPVWALARVRPAARGRDRAALLIHLINRQFNKATNAHAPLGSFQVDVDMRLVGSRRVAGAELVTPEHGTVTCPIDGTTVTVPSLDVWGILRVY